MQIVLRRFGAALLAALGLMVFFAVAAQAEDLTDGGKAGYFTVLGEKSLVKGTEVVGEQLGAGKLLIPSKNAYVECKTGKVIEAVGVSETEVSGTVRFEKCNAHNLKTEAVLGACPVLGEPSAETIDAHGVVLAKLHGEELFILIEPLHEKFLAEIKFGPECGIGVKVKVGLDGAVEHVGVVGLVDNGSEAVKHSVVFSESIQKLLGDHLLYGSAESYIDGTADVEVGAPHKGCTWAVH